jgi:hypothetical protein
VVAGRLGYSSDTALILGRAVAGSAARVKARAISRQERQTDRNTDTGRMREEHVTAPVFLLGKTIRLLQNANGELRAADGKQPSDPAGVERYLGKAFGDHLAEVTSAMETLASRYDPADLNRIGFRLYERFRPEVPHGNEGWGVKAVLEIEKILTAV